MGRTDPLQQEKIWQDRSLNSEVKSRWFIALQFFVLLFFTLFDFYKWGLRIFDIAAFFLILIFVLTHIERKWITISSLLFLMVAGVYSIAGLILNHTYLTVFALFLNCIFYCVLTLKEFKPSQMQIKIVLIIHLGFFFFQFVYFYTVGDIINYHSFTDIEPRLEGQIFRPAGLFYEPAIYCFAVFILTSMLESKSSKYGVLEALAMVSMLISVSLLGFIFALLILIKLMFNYKFLAPILCALTIIFINNQLMQPILTFVENRLFDLGSDASAVGRYGNILDLFSNENLIYHLMGRGFGASFEQFGSSGASAAISAVGILGLTLFSFWLLLRSREMVVGVSSLIVILISAPIFSYGVFPYWIANIVCQTDCLRGLGWINNQKKERV